MYDKKNFSSQALAPHKKSTIQTLNTYFSDNVSLLFIVAKARKKTDPTAILNHFSSQFSNKNN